MAGDTKTLQPGTTVDMRSLELVNISDPNYVELARRLDRAIEAKKQYGPPELRKSAVSTGEKPPVVLIHPEPAQRKLRHSL
jgi:hypothetical protein